MKKIFALIFFALTLTAYSQPAYIFKNGSTGVSSGQYFIDFRPGGIYKDVTLSLYAEALNEMDSIIILSANDTTSNSPEPDALSSGNKEWHRVTVYDRIRDTTLNAILPTDLNTYTETTFSRIFKISNDECIIRLLVFLYCNSAVNIDWSIKARK